MTPERELAALLADPANSGAYFVDARDRATFAEAASQLGFALRHVDLHECTDKDAALARIATALAFPDWFGENFDALEDCLNDLSWLPAQGYLLVFEHARGWRDAQAGAFATFVDILDAAAAEWARQRVPFWALLPLPAADLATMQPDAG